MTPVPLLLLAVPIWVGVACVWLLPREAPRAAPVVAVARPPAWWLQMSVVTAHDAWFFAVPAGDWNHCMQAVNWRAIEASAGALSVACVDLNAGTVR